MSLSVEIQTLNDGTVTTERINELDIVYEHSNFNDGEIVTRSAPIGLNTEQLVFADFIITDGGTELFRGEIEEVEEDSPEDGLTRFTGRGPGLALTRDGPGQTVTYSSIATHLAIEDYYSNYLTSATTNVVPPTPEVKSDNTLIASSTLTGVDDLYTPDAGEPVHVDFNELRPKKAVYFGVEDDFGGIYDVQFDFPGQSDPYRINGESAGMFSGNDIVSYTFSPEYTIPSEFAEIGIHGAIGGFGQIADTSFRLNGSTITSIPTPSNFDTWQFYDNPIGDIQEGNNYTIQLRTFNNTNITFDIDALVLYDTRYTSRSDFDNEITTFNGDLTGPALYPPVQLDLETYLRTYNISSASFNVSVNNSTPPFELGLSNDGSNYVTVTNSENLNVDFSTVPSYGTTLYPRITLGGYGTNAWLASGALPQTLTAFDIRVTTNALPITQNITLQGNHYENIRDLHAESAFRFVIDPAPGSDIVSIESFLEGDAVKPWDVRALKWPKRTNVRGYANQVSIIWNDGSTRKEFIGQDQDAIDALNGEIIPVELVSPEISTTDEARNKMRNELAQRTQIPVEGTIEIVSAKLLAGYSYTIPEWDGATAAAERVTFVEDRNNAIGFVQFSRDEDITQQVQEQADDLQQTKETIVE